MDHLVVALYLCAIALSIQATAYTLHFAWEMHHYGLHPEKKDTVMTEWERRNKHANSLPTGTFHSAAPTPEEQYEMDTNNTHSSNAFHDAQWKAPSQYINLSNERF